MRRAALAAVLLVVAACGHGHVSVTAPRPVEAPTTSSTSTTSAAPTTTTSTIPPGPPVVIDHGDRAVPKVALTFDSNLTTHMINELDRHEVASFDNTEVLDVLDREQVPATIFLAGLWVERYHDTAVRIAADPLFEVASHSYAHIGFAPRCYDLGLLPSAAAMAADVERSEVQLHELTPKATRYFRFPGGCYTQAALHALDHSGVVVIGYDVPGGDAFGTSVRAIVTNVLTHVRNGSIVVLHITGGNTAPLTAKALPDIVTGLRQRGFELVRVSDLL